MAEQMEQINVEEIMQDIRTVLETDRWQPAGSFFQEDHP